jgi:transcription antitermination factor NusG
VVWFAVQVKQRYERIAATALSSKGFATYVPLYERRRQWWDRAKTMQLPLFPGYVFSSFDPAHRMPILTSPGVIGVVSCGRIPAPVDEAELAAVRAIVDSSLQAEPWEYLNSGQRVRIHAGALRGIEGIVVECKNRGRLIVSIDLLQRSVAVEIDGRWVSPIGGGTAAGVEPWATARANSTRGQLGKAC